MRCGGAPKSGLTPRVGTSCGLVLAIKGMMKIAEGYTIFSISGELSCDVLHYE